MPALDLAFGLEDIANVPPDIAGWLACLTEGPLGREADEGISRPDWAAALAA